MSAETAPRSGISAAPQAPVPGGATERPGEHPSRNVCCGCSATERDAFMAWVGELVGQYRGPLLRVARREGLSPEDAFDVVQEGFQSFLTLPAARPLLGTRGDDARKLLVTLTRNLARNRRRVAAVARPHDSSDEAIAALPAEPLNLEDLLASAEDAVRLRGCVKSLGDVQRAVVTLRMLDELDAPDVARTLRISPGHVAVLLHRAKANLLSCMTT